jgi:poly(A) polymerase
VKLHDILSLIEKTAEDKGLSRPFIVGGTPRDRVRGEAKEINDIDLTTEGGDSVDLAFACSQLIPYTYFQLYDDGHAAIKIAGLQIDFSNHFIIPDIDAELNRIGVKEKTPLVREMYSRDFTINTLLQDLNFEKVFDITGQGVRDIRAGVIRCPINPDLTIKNDPKRILRAIRFALRFDYTIDSELIKSIKKYKHLLKDASPEYMSDKANELIKLDSEKAIKDRKSVV